MYLPCGHNALSKIARFIHDDVIKWKHFPCYRLFVKVNHQLPVDSPHKGQWCRTLIFFFVLRLDKRLRKQSRPGWFEMSSLLSWRHSDVLQENIHDARVLSMNFGCKKTMRDVSRCVKVRNNNIDDKIHISKLAVSLLWIGACLFHPLTPSPLFRDHFVYASYYFSDMGTLVWLSQCHWSNLLESP